MSKTRLDSKVKCEILEKKVADFYNNKDLDQIEIKRALVNFRENKNLTNEEEIEKKFYEYTSKGEQKMEKINLDKEIKVKKIETGESINREEGPILIKNGKVFKKSYINKENIMRHLKYVSKITKGLYSGLLSNDREYIKFCDNVIRKTLEERINTIVEETTIENIYET